MKYFYLLADTTELLEGAVLCETGLKKLKGLVGDASVKVEEATDFDANSCEYVSPEEIGPDANCGERKVFHDINGNEWHNYIRPSVH